MKIEPKVASAFVLMLIAGVLLSQIGCDSERDKNAAPFEVPSSSVSDWIDELEKAYLADGMREFEATRQRIRANEALLREDWDYDTASMVLGLGETSITKKEAELAVQLRALAKQIEANPNRSYQAWSSLEGKLFSYSFGNGPINHQSVPMQLAELYSLIANGPSRLESGLGGVAQAANGRRAPVSGSLVEARERASPVMVSRSPGSDL